MRKIPLTAALVLTGLLAACTDAPTPTAIGGPSLKSTEGNGNGEFITVMSRNVSIGTEVNNVLFAPPELIPIAVAAVYDTMTRTRPVDRMRGIAAEIATKRPDIVGLQEVQQWYLQVPGDFLAGNPQQASTKTYDYLTTIVNELAARGLDYRIAAIGVHTDIEAPALPPATPPLPLNFYDVRLIDRDAILVRGDLQYANAQTGNFTAGIPIVLGPIQQTYLRGWQSVDVKVHGRTVRFINTHLETQGAIPIQVAQGNELIAIAARSPLPVILVGDFNSAINASAPPGKATPTYGNMIGAGYSDAWSVSHPGDEGLTCCHDEIFPWLFPGPVADQRLDFVFYKGGFTGVGAMSIFGNDFATYSLFNIWPSDHFGIIAQVRLP
jgi:endonuclease/exonuclease/phosphatase family metal-dependent hydrolase